MSEELRSLLYRFLYRLFYQIKALLSSSHGQEFKKFLIVVYEPARQVQGVNDRAQSSAIINKTTISIAQMYVHNYFSLQLAQLALADFR
jgi:hypothetical protein